MKIDYKRASNRQRYLDRLTKAQRGAPLFAFTRLMTIAQANKLNADWRQHLATLATLAPKGKTK